MNKIDGVGEGRGWDSTQNVSLFTTSNSSTGGVRVADSLGGADQSRSKHNWNGGGRRGRGVCQKRPADLVS